ncbi:hypothetical protein [Yinghuangia sp. YIM S09857]|uniref:hypothetical protein n=1 Tax=Yinghuangia sp. YIM S09857 TaxID=3436929 RepID=UPI003F53BC07
MTRHGDQHGTAFSRELAAHLRGRRIGPARTGTEALIRLRAIQVQVWQRGHLLR